MAFPKHFEGFMMLSFTSIWHSHKTEWIQHKKRWIRKDGEEIGQGEVCITILGEERYRQNSHLSQWTYCPAQSVEELKIPTSCRSPDTHKILWISPNVLVHPAAGPHRSWWIISVVSHSFRTSSTKLSHPDTNPCCSQFPTMW